MSPRSPPPVPMTWRVHVLPPSNVTATAIPATTSGKVDITTTFSGFVGLMAMASSASLPLIAVASKFGGIAELEALAGSVPADARASRNKAIVEATRIASGRRAIVSPGRAVQAWGRDLSPAACAAHLVKTWYKDGF